MKTTKLLLTAAALTFNFGLQTLNCRAQCPAFANQSFEKSPASPYCTNCVPTSWTICGTTGCCFACCTNSSPDVWAGADLPTVPLLPKDGANYAGIGYYGYLSSPPLLEEIGQTLSTPLTAGAPYSFNIAIYVMNAAANKGQLEIWGGNSSCAKTQLLWTSPVITNEAAWATYTVTFAPPTSGWKNITFRATCPTCINNDGANSEGAYFFIDDLCGLPLPITLLTFTANCNPSPTLPEGKGVTVRWATASEINNDYFTIERSTSPDPSKGGGLNWEVAGTVKGAGNSSTVRSYEFIDNQVLPFGEDLGGVVYYRLTQTDFDGKTETFNSNQVAVDVTECAVQVFPNPAGNTLNVPYAAEQDGEITLQVYDVIGKLVKEKAVTAVKGNNKFTIDLTTVAQGMYVLKVKGTAKENNQKFVKGISQ